jgi:hypothetical protein
MEFMEEFPEEFSEVVLGPHSSLTERRRSEELENELLNKIRAEGEVNLSKLWLSSHCHLWEITHALRMLKDKGLIKEKEL